MKTRLAILVFAWSAFTAFADPNSKSDKYFLKHGVHSALFGELGAQVTKEYSKTPMALFNFEAGVQFLKIDEHSIAVGYVIRGFDWVHTGNAPKKITFHGPMVEYMYPFDFVSPHVSFSYLTGDSLTDRGNDIREVDTISKYELEATADFYFDWLQGSILVGYAYSRSRHQVTENYPVPTTKGGADDTEVIASSSPREWSSHGSIVLGVQFSSF